MSEVLSPIACVERVDGLGRYAFNWSPGESHRMAREAWVRAAEVIAFLASRRNRFMTGETVIANGGYLMV